MKNVQNCAYFIYIYIYIYIYIEREREREREIDSHLGNKNHHFKIKEIKLKISYLQ